MHFYGEYLKVKYSYKYKSLNTKNFKTLIPIKLNILMFT